MQSLSAPRQLLGSLARHWYPAGMELKPTIAISVRWKMPRKRMNRLAKKNPARELMVPVHKRMEFGENDEIQRIKLNYDAQNVAIMDYLQALNSKRGDNKEAIRLEKEEEEREHRRLMAYNDEENQRVLELRMRSESSELARRVEHLMERKERNLARESTLRTAALQAMQQTEEFVKTCIPVEDFDRLLADSYDNPVNYEFAITLDGKVLRQNSEVPETVSDLPREAASPFKTAKELNSAMPHLPEWTVDPVKAEA